MSITGTSLSREHLQAAREALRLDDPERALSCLAAGFQADASDRECYALAAECLRQLGAADEAALFQDALEGFARPEPFYDLGYHFMDSGHPRLAIPFLERTLKLAPGSVEAASELAVACCRTFQPKRAREALERSHWQGDFLASYQYFWCSLLCGETRGLPEFIAWARREMVSGPGPLESDVVDLMIARLEECLLRLNAVGKPALQIQHWHFIQYGAAILDFFDDRLDPNGLDVAGGRWVNVYPSCSTIAGILWKLRRFLRALNRRPLVVVSLPDRDSEIIARAAAGILRLPYHPEPEFQQPDSLVIAADSRLIESPELSEIREQQTLFSLNLHWLTDSLVTPDVAGMMAQGCYLPWNGEGILLDPADFTITDTEPDDRPSEEIAREIATSGPKQDRHIDEILEFYRARSYLMKGSPGARRWRAPFRTDSPVPGAFFT